jgi:cation-transporting ATPase 13A3/4/5
MSVITRTLGDKQFHIYVKGAPEKIIELCRPNSIPKNFGRHSSMIFSGAPLT